ARVVVHDDPRDARALRRSLLTGVDADDVGEEPDSRRIELEVADDRALEVARLDVLAVRVLQPLAERELEIGAVAVRLRQALRDRRDDLRAAGADAAGAVTLGHQTEIDVLEDLPRLEPVGETRVQV